MNAKKIFSRNAVYQKFGALLSNRNKRHRYGEFIIEGVRNINEAVKNGWKIKSFVYSRNKSVSDWARKMLRDIKTDVNYELTEELLAELSGKDDSSELLAVAAMGTDGGADAALSGNPILALFDRPSNKGNLGTLIRSCDAFGVERLIITGHSVDIYDPEVIGASMGSFFGLPIISFSDNSEIDGYIAGLKDRFPKMKVIGTTSHDRTVLSQIDLTAPVLFLIGNESDGLNRHLSESSDIMATIPMDKNSSASSFNVSCAATVMFYEAARQRKTKG